MSNSNTYTSPVRRACHCMEPWLDLLPGDAKSEAQMALQGIQEVAEREIQQAYHDGAATRSNSVRAAKAKTALTTP